MKISMSMEHAIRIGKVSAPEGARMMKEAGFDAIDLILTRNQTNPDIVMAPEWRETFIEQAEAIKAAGLQIAQCHIPYYGGHLPRPGDGSYQAWEDFMLPMLLRAIDICGEIGCPIAVLHPYYEEGNDAASHEGNIRLIAKLLPTLKKANTRLALENVWGKNYAELYVTHEENLLAIVKEVNDPFVGVCLDTGHANIFRIDIANAVRVLGDHLIALHVHGNAGKDEHVIPYTMSDWCERMDFNAFVKALYEIGYKGTFNLEVATGKVPQRAAQAYLNYAAAVAKGLCEDNAPA